MTSSNAIGRIRDHLPSLGYLLGSLLILAWTLFPIAWIVLSSFKPPAEQFAIPPQWIPSHFTLENYVSFLNQAELIRPFINSTLITLSAISISLILGVPTAYSLARFDFRYGQLISFMVLFARMVPPITMVLPFFLISRFLNLTGTYPAIILVHTFFALPFAIWMMRGFFDGVPPGLEEAAMVDGCSRLEAIRKVTLPLVAPGLAATSVLVALITWNEFMYALVLTNTKTRTIPVLIKSFVSEKSVSWGIMSASGLLAAIPLIIFGLLIQNYLVRGLTAGGMKG